MTPQTEPPPAPTAQIHLWLLEPHRWEDAAELGRCDALLSAAERDRAACLPLPEVRQRYVIARALVRRTLSRFAPIDPTAWTFASSAHGRPEIAGPAGAPRLRFSVSHTHGLMGCAVAHSRELGLDLEDAEHRSPDTARRVAARFFSAPEREALERLPHDERARHFFALWTLKEAYLKARGLGLSLPLEQFTVELHPSGRAELFIDEQLHDDPAQWQLVPLQPTPRHAGALVVRRAPGADLEVRVAWA